MSKTIRTILLGLVGAVALSTAGSALAAYTSPSLRVTDSFGTRLRLKSQCPRRFPE